MNINDLYEYKRQIEELISHHERKSVPLPERAVNFIKRVKSVDDVRWTIFPKWLDEKLNGMPKACFFNLVGSSYAGKTYLGMQILSEISKQTKTLFFSFEMYEGLMVQRLKKFDKKALENMYIEQKENNLEKIRIIIEKMHKEKNVEFVLIDSRMKIKTKDTDEYMKNTNISHTLSKLVQNLGITILLINQISEADLRQGRLSIKGSGDQVYDSDIILYIVPEIDESSGLVKKRTYYCSKDRFNERTWKYVV